MGIRALSCALLSAILCGSSAGPASPDVSIGLGPVGFDGSLSVLTYNVKGLPWPLAGNRSADLRAIAARLRQLRLRAHAPQVVLLQEAFSDDARAIGRVAGYRFVLDGPSRADTSLAPANAQDVRFLAGASPFHGETEGLWLDSGLQLLSDYPVVAIRRMAFPAYACAGFDCLASKGALLVSVEIPGVPEPVDIVATHLNSRNSSGVSDARSLHAYRRQAELLTSFVNRWHDPSHPLIVAGDFNTGRARPRWRALLAQIAAWRAGGAIGNALPEVARRDISARIPLTNDLRAIVRRGSDWQFFASGKALSLRAVGVDVPFGTAAGGRMLSDHIGYVAHYRFAAR